MDTPKYKGRIKEVWAEGRRGYTAISNGRRRGNTFKRSEGGGEKLRNRVGRQWMKSVQEKDREKVLSSTQLGKSGKKKWRA